MAHVCAKALLVDPNRDSQSPYVIWVPSKKHGDGQVLKARERIEADYAKIEAIGPIAKEAGISPRHFKRRFKQATGLLPLKYLQQVRIDSARERLETTNDPIDQITWAVGYKDVSSFCRLFRQHTNLTPGACRARFGSSGLGKEKGWKFNSIPFYNES